MPQKKRIFLKCPAYIEKPKWDPLIVLRLLSVWVRDEMKRRERERARTSKKQKFCAFLCCTPECVVVVVIKHLLLRCFRFYGGQKKLFFTRKKKRLHEFLYNLKNIFSVKNTRGGKKNGNEWEKKSIKAF